MSRQLTYGSLFSGLGALDLGFDRAGWRCAWQCEIDPQARRVLRHHWPAVPLYEDVTTLKGADLEPVDLVLGGPPCQDWSVAGARSGLAGERSRLFDHLPRIAREVSASWLVFENVCGLLSQDSGRDFAFVLGQFTGAQPEVPEGGWKGGGFGWGPYGACAWRIHNAQFWGVAQRRRRVFAVVRLGDFRGLADKEPRQDQCRLLSLPFQVLFDEESLRGHPAPRGKARKKTARSPRSGTASESGIAATLQSRSHSPGVNAPGRGGEDDQNLVVSEVYQSTGAGTERPGSPSLSASDDNGSNAVVMAFDKYNQADTGDVACTVSAGSKKHNNAHLPHVVVGPLGATDNGRGHRVGADEVGAGHVVCVTGSVTHTLKAGGADGSEDGTGRGQPIVAIPIDTRQTSRGQKMTNNRREGSSGGAPGTGVGQDGDAAPSLAETHTPAVAYSIAAAESRAKVSHAHESDTARTLDSKGGFADNQGSTVVAFHATQDPISGDVSPALGQDSKAGCGSVGVAYTLLGRPATEVARETETAACLRARVPGQQENSTTNVIAFQERGRGNGTSLDVQPDLAYALTAPANDGRSQERNISDGMMVRRLTVVECLRLQALPDDFLLLDPPLSDSACYRLIGNSACVNLLEWLAERIKRVHEEAGQ